MLKPLIMPPRHLSQRGFCLLADLGSRVGGRLAQMTWLVVALFPIWASADNESIQWGQTTIDANVVYGFAEATHSGVDANAVGAPPDGEFAEIRRDFTVVSTLPVGTPVAVNMVIELSCDPGTAQASLQVFSDNMIIFSKAVGGAGAYADTKTLFLHVGGSYHLVALVEVYTLNFAEANATVTLLQPMLFNQDMIGVSGRVLDAVSRLPLAGASVTLGGQSTSTSTSGDYSFASISVSLDNVLTATKSGMTTNRVSVNPPAGAVTYIVPDIYLAPAGSFMVVSITPKYDGLFLSGASVFNEYTASVSWEGRTPAAVEFSVNGILAKTILTTTDKATAEFDMGSGPSGFVGRLTLGANKLQAVAVDNLGVRSLPLEQNVKIIPSPLFLSSQGILLPFEFLPGNDPGLKWEFNFPLSLASARDIRQIPFIGDIGADFNFDCRVDYSIVSGKWGVFAGEEWTSRLRSVKGRRPNLPKFKLGNVDFQARAGLKAEGVASQTRGFVVDRAGIEADFGVKAEIGNYYITDWVPGGQLLRLLDGLKSIGIDPNSIQKITVYGMLAAQVNLMAEFNPDIHFGYLSVTLKPGVEAVYKPNVWVARGEIIVGGGFGIAGELSPNLGWKKITGEILFSIRFEALGREIYKESFVIVRGTIWESAIAMRSLAGSAPLAQIKIDGEDWFVFRVQPEPLGVSPRGYLAAGPEQFVAIDAEVKRLAAATATVSPLESFRQIGRPQEFKPVTKSEKGLDGPSPAKINDAAEANLTILANVFPGADPAMASRGQDLMLLYVTDNGSSNNFQFTDIKWTRFDGTNWSVPATIQTNTQAESSPQVTYDGNGDAIAVWERVADPNFTNQDLTATAAQMEVVWAKWNRTNGQWSAPVPLTSNGYLDHAPLLCGPMTDGAVLVTWTANTANLLMGTNGAGSQVLSAEWNPGNQSWSSPQTLLADLPNRLSQSLSGVSNRAVYAWTRDFDGVFTNAADQQVFYCAWNNGGWGAVTQFTTNTSGNRNARVSVGSDGPSYLVWQSATNLVLSQDFSTNASMVRADSQTAGFADYAMTIGPNGNLVLLWQQLSQAGSDAHYAVYDPASATWSKDVQFFDDSPLEGSFSPVWDDVGNLTFAYNKVEILITNQTVTLEGGATVTITNVPQSGRVDLCVTKRKLIKDVSLAAGDFTADAENYLPGAAVTLSATVRNFGDLAVSNAMVGFYDGNPTNGGVLITNIVISGWLEGAATNTVSALWAVPGPAKKHILYAVADPAGALTEFDEVNNTQSLSVGGTDLAVSLVSQKVDTNGALRVIAQVLNLGAPFATNTVLAIRRAGQTNAPLATTAVPLLEPGRLAQVALDLPAGTHQPGESLYTLSADDAHVISDVETNNNSTSFAVMLWLDSDSDGMPDHWEIASSLNRFSAADAALDPDNDGLTNLQEYQQGKSPLVFDNLRVGPSQYLPDGKFQINVFGEIGKSYVLQASTNLATWNPLFNFACTNSPTVVVDPTAMTFKYRFYRVADLALLTQNTPLMTLLVSGNNAVISWPTNSTGFTLEYKANLSAVSWTSNSVVPSIVSGRYTVTNPVTSGTRFYRLKK